MADERDPKLSQRYRELEPLEPPAELDRKILDAAHAAASPHAPLVTPAGRHRWYYGLAAAAVLVFAVALTLHMERERPDPEAAPSGPPLRLERELRGQIKPAPQPEAKPASKPESRAPVAEERAAPPVFTPDPTARQDSGASPQNVEALAARREAAAAQRMAATPATAQVAAAPESPARWLERIAELRSRGRHVEADRELAAFRKANPDYRLSDAMRERVEGTPTPSR